MSKPRIQLIILACFFVFAMLLVGCHDPITSKIAGTWEIQKAGRLGKRINQDQEKSDSRMRIVFQANGGLVTQTSIGEIQGKKSGAWKLVSFDEETGQMVLSCDLGSGEVRTGIEFVDADTIRLVPPNMAGTKSKLRFVRVK